MYKKQAESQSFVLPVIGREEGLVECLHELPLLLVPNPGALAEVLAVGRHDVLERTELTHECVGVGLVDGGDGGQHLGQPDGVVRLEPALQQISRLVLVGLEGHEILGAFLIPPGAQHRALVVVCDGGDALQRPRGVVQVHIAQYGDQPVLVAVPQLLHTPPQVLGMQPMVPQPDEQHRIGLAHQEVGDDVAHLHRHSAPDEADHGILVLPGGDYD
mmetsp:Transcript_31267/g.77460  ORF Transcript_31267/g.77460 Transcript_31267/m.77460 type:complete len:216 (+) Transcript_31267:757-1404(+)